MRQEISHIFLSDAGYPLNLVFFHRRVVGMLSENLMGMLPSGHCYMKISFFLVFQQIDYVIIIA